MLLNFLFAFDGHDWILSKQIFESVGDLRGKVVGDIGCGWGNFSFKLAKYARFVYGVDKRKNVIGRLKGTNRSNIKFMFSDAQKLPFKNNFFDVLIYRDVLEHIEDDKKAINEGLRVLKRGGLLVMSVPNKTFVENYNFPVSRALKKTFLGKHHVIACDGDNFQEAFFKNFNKYVGHKNFYTIEEFQGSKRYRLVKCLNTYNGVSKYVVEFLSFKGNFNPKRRSFLIIKLLSLLLLFPSLFYDEFVRPNKNQGFGFVLSLKKI